MTKENKQQRKKKGESDDEHNVSKIGKYTQSPSGKKRTIEISDLLNETNTILYESEIQNRTEHDIYFNLSIYIQLIVANKTYIHSMHK